MKAQGKKRGNGGQYSGILLMLLSCALLSAHDAITKLLTDGYPVSEIIFIRGAVATLIVLFYEFLRNNISALRPNDAIGQFIRAGLFAASTVLITISLKLLPLSIVTAVIFTAPVMVAVLSGPLLKEKVGYRTWAGALIGFCGAILIISPAGTAWSWAILVPLGAAAASALRDIVTRHLALRETTSSIILSTVLAATIIGAFGFPFAPWNWPTVLDWMLFAMVGATQSIAHYLQVEAFRITAANILAPFKYSMLVWALILGLLIWGELPSSGILAGAALIILAGVLASQQT